MKVKLLSSNQGSMSLWQIENKNIMLFSIGKQKRKYLPEFIEQLKRDIEDTKSLIDISRKIGGATNIFRIARTLYPELFTNYLQEKARFYTNKRIKITINSYLIDIFGRCDHLFDTSDGEEYKEIIALIVRNEYEYQCTHFIETNQVTMNSNNDSWVLYWVDGLSLCKREFDFRKINSPTIRKEVMEYFKDRLSTKTRFRNDEGIALVTRAVNYLTSYKHSVKFFADIEETDVASLLDHLLYDAKTQHGNSLAPGTVSDIFGDCGLIVSFLMNHDNKIPKGFPRPSHNYFMNVEFNNISNMEKRTQPIPDCVINQLYLHLEELLPIHQAIFKIFDGTGLRADEVVKLEENCLEYNEDKDIWLLKYIPTKVLEARRRNGLPDEHYIGLRLEEVKLIQEQIKKTELLRQSSGLKNIFLHEMTFGNRTAPVKVVQGYAFNTAINRLIKKYNIVDEDGKLWHFSSRQFRKTVAMTMIENGATPREVGYHFGHMEYRTNLKYYSEVAEYKLADLNTEFFKKKFEITLGPEQLAAYTEEERRALYVDFCLSHREVELGSCIRHFSQGPCGKRNGNSNCATCGNICTGSRYLHKWIDLRDSAQKRVDELVALYAGDGITEYQYFKEYQRELYFLQSYEATIAKIVGSNAFPEITNHES